VNGVQPEQRIKRELTLREVISKTFEVFRRDFRKYIVLFAVVEVIIGVVMALAQNAFVLPTPPLTRRPSSSPAGPPGSLEPWSRFSPQSLS